MRYLVTGGGGFVGRSLCLSLVQAGHEVISLSRGSYPELVEAGIETISCDISTPDSEFESHFQDVDGVFHVAAKVGMWGDYKDFHKVNVLGTQNIIAACRARQVRRLVYTSSPSVIADGSNLKGVNESYPYPKNYLASYPRSKAKAEQLVLAANDNDLSTLALRPHLIWGPGDTNLIPTLLSKYQSGRLKIVGSGTNLCDFSYIDDCVQAHVCAMNALQSAIAQVSGRAYFISQGDPMNLWSWINEILHLHNLSPVKKRVPFVLAYGVASLSELAVRCLPSLGEPYLSKFLVEEMATDHYFDISAARNQLKYEPEFTMQSAIADYAKRMAIVGSNQVGSKAA